MAVAQPNPLIPLSVKAPDVVGAFQSGQRGERQNQLLQAQTAGVQQRTQVQGAEAKAAADARQKRDDRISFVQGVAPEIREIVPDLDILSAADDQNIGDDDPRFQQVLEAQARIQQRLDSQLGRLQQSGQDTTGTTQLLSLLKTGNVPGMQRSVEDLIQLDDEINRQVLGLGPDPRRAAAAAVPSEIRTREQLLRDAQDPNLAADDPRKASALVSLGVSPRAGTVTGRERAAIDPGLGTQVAEQVAREEAAKETAKLSAQLQLLPEVKSAVETTVARATLAGDEAAKNRSNERALNIYEIAVQGLTSALGETITGPILGRGPALSANQQIADGAVAAMAPILKQMFRSSGEGTFTDQDQKLLTSMIPTRADKPEARAAKLDNIDAIIRAKLTPLPPIDGAADPAAQQPGQQDVLRFDAQGNLI